MGFLKTLGREYPLWDFRFVIFDSPWSERKHSDFVRHLSSAIVHEPLLRVDEHGAFLVPGIVPSAAPSGQHPFQPSLPLTISETKLVQTSLIPHPADFVTLEVLTVSYREGNRTFVGQASSPVKATHLVAHGLFSSQILCCSSSCFVSSAS